ncbi:MAG: DAK2 domain-containing protein [Mycoplasmatales bacterium]
MNKLTAKKYREMLLYGGEILAQKKEEINALNVFPVPDGDTGSNMNMTIQSGSQSLLGLKTDSMEELAKAYSKGLLMGARGNSGVILSQFFRGISEGCEGREELTAKEFHKAVGKGVKRAYASVIKAVEGTILTVAREMHENVHPKADDSIVDYFEQLIEAANESLDDTPNKLAVLKEVGVVDSGGKGLVTIFEGMLANLKGETIEYELDESFENFRKTEEHPMDLEDITFGYCTEMLIQLDNFEEVDVHVVREKLETFGDSIVCIQDDEILKVHVHTEDPNAVFAYGRELGDFIHLKSENMRIQVINAQGGVEQVQKEQAIVAVASSKEMAELFKEISEVTIIEGGQTLNPSTEEIVKAVKKANAKNVIVLPNNSNIIMAAQSATELCDDVNVEIIPTKHMTQAVECLTFFNPNESFETNVKSLTEVKDNVENIEITTAIKDTSIEGVEIKQNDLLAIVNGKIKYSTKSISKLFKQLATDLTEADVEVIIVLKGQNADQAKIDEFIVEVEKVSPFTEVNVYETNQPVYPYLIAGV